MTRIGPRLLVHLIEGQGVVIMDESSAEEVVIPLLDLAEVVRELVRLLGVAEVGA